MKVEYNNLYTHFVFTTLHRLPLIVEQHGERIEKVCNYILKQPEHHRKVSYMEEYETFIKFHQITINPKYGNKVFVHESGFSTEVAY